MSPDKDEPEVSGSGSEAAPDSDFVEADAEASTELAEEEEVTEEYDTEVEAPEEVRWGAGRPADALRFKCTRTGEARSGGRPPLWP